MTSSNIRRTIVHNLAPLGRAGADKDELAKTAKKVAEMLRHNGLLQLLLFREHRRASTSGTDEKKLRALEAAIRATEQALGINLTPVEVAGNDQRARLAESTLFEALELLSLVLKDKPQGEPRSGNDGSGNVDERSLALALGARAGQLQGIAASDTSTANAQHLPQLLRTHDLLEVALYYRAKDKTADERRAFALVAEVTADCTGVDIELSPLERLAGLKHLEVISHVAGRVALMVKLLVEAEMTIAQEPLHA